MPCYLVHRVCHSITFCMLGCILVAFHAYHAYCIVFGIGVSPGTGNEARFVLRVTERVSIPKSLTLRITHDGVRFYCSIHMHSSYIELCNLTPRPSCIEMRDWWHEDRGVHTYVKILCHAPFLLSVAANQKPAVFWSYVQNSGLNCKQRLIGASQWISAPGNPSMHHSSFETEPRWSMDLRASLLLF